MGRVKKSVVKRVLVPVLAVLVIAGVFAVSASAEPPSAVDSAGSSAEVSQLPNGFSPEGIAIDERAAVAYTGSLVDGAIERIDLKTGEATPFAPSPGPHRMASGMDIDRFGRLWVAGGGGFVPGVVSGFRVYDTRSGAVPADVTVPDAGYLNDVTVTRDAAWFTDSLGPALIRVPIGADGTIGSPEKVALGGDWVQTSAGFNANGIETTPDGRHLIVNQTQSADAHSAFYLVPTQVAGLADARRVTLDGTTDGADGLELIGRTLYVANPQGVVEINLSGSLTDGQILGTTGVPGAAWPSAAKAFGGRLYVLDANFGANLSNVGNPAAAFQVIAIPLP
jgi:sugar lactone lactonase YvrE